VKFGIVTSFGGVDDYVEMAKEAEASGWDGVFAWDDISVGPREVFDPWVALGAMAAVTERVTLGAMVFSLARRRPWKVARETLTLDSGFGFQIRPAPDAERVVAPSLPILVPDSTDAGAVAAGPDRRPGSVPGGTCLAARGARRSRP
jgi:hypothetical protein